MVEAGGVSALNAGVTAAEDVSVIEGVVAEATVLVAVTVKVPDPLGVPDRIPVTAFRVSPAGSAPEATVKVGAGKPAAAKV